MKREILITATPHESWVALLENDSLVELMFDRPDEVRLVGDIYLGKVDAVLPGIQAAFVDIGTEKAGFLHASDLATDGDEGEGAKGDGDNGGGSGRRARKAQSIQSQVKKGDSILVQVSKESIGTKGPRLTAEVSLPGRFLVYLPDSSHVGVSRKIDGREERARLRVMAKDILPPDSGGIIVRTVGEEVTQEAMEREFKQLRKQWQKIQRSMGSQEAPALVHREAKLVSGIIRDLFSNKFDRVVVDSKEIHNEVSQYVRNVDPDLLERVQFYRDSVPLFDRHNVDEDIQAAFKRRVNLPSGGYIILEPTEALVSIDVNTGRYTGRKDPEHTILRTNLDAAREVAKQIRLRDVGGIIVVDFIDMESQANRDQVLHELKSHLGHDRARTKAFEVSDLGLIEMTRQRVRPSLFQSLTQACEHCGGTGRVYTPATVIRRIERSIKRVSASKSERRIVVRLHPEVALQLLEEEPDFLRRLGGKMQLDLGLRDDPLLCQDEFRLLAGPAETDVTAKYAGR